MGWIGAKTAQERKISCCEAVTIAALSKPYLVLISADAFRLLLKARFMSQASRLNFDIHIPQNKYGLSGTRYRE
jgi:hypothetical protein